MSTSTFWIGYGNLYAPYTFTEDWLRRAPLIAAKIRQMGVSSFVGLEAHGDTTAAGGDGKTELDKYTDGKMRPIYYPLLENLPSSWDIAEGEGGNHWFYDAAKYDVLKTRDILMPGSRWMTGWKVERLDSGAQFWVNAAHLTAGSTPDRIADREAQGRFLADTIVSTGVVIFPVDMNNSKKYTGSPRAVLEADGLLGLREKSLTGVVNGDLASHHDDAPGTWLDDILSSPSVTVEEAEQVETNDLADHNFFKALVTIPV